MADFKYETEWREDEFQYDPIKELDGLSWNFVIRYWEWELENG